MVIAALKKDQVQTFHDQYTCAGSRNGPFRLTEEARELLASYASQRLTSSTFEFRN
jgi:hypothetical protein